MRSSEKFNQYVNMQGEKNNMHTYICTNMKYMFNKINEKCKEIWFLAEREGFEPSVPLPVRNISNVVHSAALSPLQRHINYC